MKECEYADQIICPYCNVEFTDSYEYIPRNGEECTEVECIECGKEFDLTIHQGDYRYSSYCKEGKHKYEKLERKVSGQESYECSCCGDMLFKDMLLEELDKWKEKIKEYKEGESQHTYCLKIIERNKKKLSQIKE